MGGVEVGDPQRIGNYAIRGRLGQGAMGTVYLGLSPGGRSVALKVVRAELARDPEFRDRFRQEIDSARAVGGFWTAAVVDADPSADQPWLATEYVPGPTLAEAVERHGPLPEPALRRLTAGLAEALAAIHAAGLLHRDLKPSNVLLAADGPRVIDFGIAKAVHAAHGVTGTGIVVGTPGFLSPEQIEAGVVGPASDVFALGSVLVHAATARPPFGDFGLATTLYKIVHGQPDLEGMPPVLRAIASRCLDPRAESRPTPGDLLAEIGHPDHAEWLPAAVRDLVEEHRTRLLAPVPRPGTRVYTGVVPAGQGGTVEPPTGGGVTSVVPSGPGFRAGGPTGAASGEAGAPERGEAGCPQGGPAGGGVVSGAAGSVDNGGSLAPDDLGSGVREEAVGSGVGLGALAEEAPTEWVEPGSAGAGRGVGGRSDAGWDGSGQVGDGSWPAGLGPRPGGAEPVSDGARPLAASPGEWPPGVGGRSGGSGSAGVGLDGGSGGGTGADHLTEHRGSGTPGSSAAVGGGENGTAGSPRAENAGAWSAGADSAGLGVGRGAAGESAGSGVAGAGSEGTGGAGTAGGVGAGSTGRGADGSGAGGRGGAGGGAGSGAAAGTGTVGARTAGAGGVDAGSGGRGTAEAGAFGSGAGGRGGAGSGTAEVAGAGAGAFGVRGAGAGGVDASSGGRGTAEAGASGSGAAGRGGAGGDAGTGFAGAAGTGTFGARTAGGAGGVDAGSAGFEATGRGTAGTGTSGPGAAGREIARAQRTGSRDLVAGAFGSGVGLPAQYHPDAAGPPARMVFESGRVRPFVHSVTSGIGSLFFLGWSGTVRYETVLASGLFLIAAVLGVAAVAALWVSLRPRSVVEVSGQGIVVLRPGRRLRIDWHQVSRVRVVSGVTGRPWLVVWPREGVPGLGSTRSGMRLAPIGHWVGPGRRSRDVAELRVALAWYGGSVYDSTP